MTTAAASVLASRPAARTADRSESPAHSDEGLPTNLKLLLGVLVVFGFNIAAVLYLAAQMPH